MTTLHAYTIAAGVAACVVVSDEQLLRAFGLRVQLYRRRLKILVSRLPVLWKVIAMRMKIWCGIYQLEQNGRQAILELNAKAIGAILTIR